MVSQNQIVLRLQPQVNRQGRTVGAEALLRWNHPKLGMLVPEKFMELAERRGISREIDAYVLEHAIKLLGEWQSDENTRDIRLSVNSSAEQLFHPDLPQTLRTLFKRYAAPAGLLTLEFTEESLARRRNDTVKALASLKNHRGSPFAG